MIRNIRSKAMLATHHSWAIVMRSILNVLVRRKYSISLESINGIENVDSELQKYFNNDIGVPDLDITYTMPRNFNARFRSDSKIKAAIYNYETSILPPVWKDSHKYLDFILPSSNFSRKVFLDAGYPAEKLVVIPHGINKHDFATKEKITLQNDRSFRFLNVSIPHRRKNLDLLLKAYYSAFNESDDVCLVIKTSLAKPNPNFKFEVDFQKILSDVQSNFIKKKRALPKVEVLTSRVDSMAQLYNSCDALINVASSEGFGLPLLEGLASGLIVMAPRCSGQLDFLNSKNSVLFDVDEIKADETYQYWQASNNAKTWRPDIDDVANKMLYVYKNKDKLNSFFEAEAKNTVDLFSWDNAVDKILKLEK